MRGALDRIRHSSRLRPLRLLHSRDVRIGEWLVGADKPGKSRFREAMERWYFRRSLEAFLADIVKPGELVFDIGANVGEWTVVLRSLGCSVVAIEPQRECIAALEARFAGDRRVTVLPAAVAAQEGEIELYRAPGSSTHATASRRWMETTETLPHDHWEAVPEIVPAITLDRLIRDYGLPSYCKIDVEGLEPEALQGLSSPVPLIEFEFHKELDDDLRRCLDRLTALGPYTFNLTFGARPQLQLADWVPPGEILRVVRNPLSPNWGNVIGRIDPVAGGLAQSEEP